jgi:hypothetical protein
LPERSTTATIDGGETMLRAILILGMAAIIIAGCASSKTEAQKRREAFRLAHIPKSESSRYLKASKLMSNGDYYYFRAKNTPEMKDRKAYLKSACSNYRKAITRLEEIAAVLEDKADREFVISVIDHTKAILEEAVRLLPIFQE